MCVCVCMCVCSRLHFSLNECLLSLNMQPACLAFDVDPWPLRFRRSACHLALDNVSAALADAEACIRLTGGSWEQGLRRREAVLEKMAAPAPGSLLEPVSVRFIFAGMNLYSGFWNTLVISL